MNTEQLLALKAEILTDSASYGYSALGQDYQSIADLLNDRPDIDNPAAQGTVQLLPTLDEVYAVVLSEQPDLLLTLYSDYAGLMSDIKSVIQLQDLAGINRAMAIVNPLLTDATRIALGTLMARTQLDPSWSATVPGDSRATVLGLPVVKAADVQSAMHLEV